MSCTLLIVSLEKILSSSTSKRIIVSRINVDEGINEFMTQDTGMSMFP